MFAIPNQKPENLIRKHKYWRLLETIPGLLTWGTFLLVIVGSIFFSIFTANIIILYTLIWVFRSIYFSYHLTRSHYYSQKALKTNWTKINDLIDNPLKLEYIIKKKKFEIDPILFKLKKGPLEPHLLQTINSLKKTNQYLRPSEIIHCVTLVTYQETLEVIKMSINSIVESNFNLKKVIFMLACEEADLSNALPIINYIKDNYSQYFKDILYSIHPKNLPNELKGRAANATFAAKVLKKYLDQNNISYEKIVLSSLDADTVISNEYLNELTFRYAITENRVKTGYQPIPFYHNNIWDVPVFNRLVAISSSFWQMSVSLRPDENKSFSSRAMSFQSVIDFGYWDTTVVQDDSRQFWTEYFIYNGDHKLENIYSPVYMDAVLSDTYWKTLKSQYKQLRRWAWGASDFPFIVFNMLANKHIPINKKIYEIFHFLESIFFWATGPIILFVAGNIPSLLNNTFKDTVLAYNLPLAMSWLMGFATLGILVCVIITIQILPLRETPSWFHKISLILQWILIPIVSIILSSIPAIDAQTRLLFNRRLDFQVTKKSRKKNTQTITATA